MKRFILLVMVLGVPLRTFATIFEVGQGKTYATPNALYNSGNNTIQPGDTIEIYGGTYSGQASLAVWSDDNLLIRGVDSMPKLYANGAYILGKGIWVLSGDNIIVENIGFFDASVPDKNGAGIRLDGTGLTVRYCYFHNNEDGILTSNPGTGDILIEFTEFSHGGFGDGFSHNLYIGRVNKLTFRYNYSHHTNIGHNLKSRAKENYIYYNRIMDESSGNSSRLVDLSEGGFSILMANLFMQGPNAPNSNLIGYGLEGLAGGAIHELYVVNNTFVNKRTASHLYLDIKSGTSVAYIANNIFAGGTNIENGNATFVSNNFASNDVATLQFLDEPNYDYHLTTSSPAIDHGMVVPDVSLFSLTPEKAYEHPTGASSRSIAGDSIDIGAYEHGLVTSNGHLITSPNEITVYPNPFTDLVVIKGDLANFEVKVFNQLGQEVVDFSNAESPIYVDTSTLGAGIYFISILHTSNFNVSFYKLIKN